MIGRCHCSTYINLILNYLCDQLHSHFINKKLSRREVWWSQRRQWKCQISSVPLQGSALSHFAIVCTRIKHRSAQRSTGEGDGTPLQYSCLENPTDGGAWKAVVHGVAEGRTRLSDFTFTFHFHALEKEMATHSSVLSWRIPGTGEPGGLLSMGSHRVGHD